MAELDRATLIKRELFLRVLGAAKPPAVTARRLVRIMTEREFEPGQIVFEQGQPSRHIYFLTDGEIELREEGEETWRFGAGSVIGALDANMQRPRARTAIAISKLKALEVVVEEWREIVEDSPAFSNRMRSELARSLHELVLILAPDGGFPVVEIEDEFETAAGVDGTVVERLVALRRCEHWRHASLQTLALVAERGEVLRGQRGDTLLRPGNSRQVMLVLAGVVEAERRLAPTLVARFGPSSLVLGGLSFGGALSEYAVSAVTDTVVLLLSISDVEAIAEDHADLSLSVIRALAYEREAVMKEQGRRKGKLLEL